MTLDLTAYPPGTRFKLRGFPVSQAHGQVFAVGTGYSGTERAFGIVRRLVNGSELTEPDQWRMDGAWDTDEDPSEDSEYDLTEALP